LCYIYTLMDTPTILIICSIIFAFIGWFTATNRGKTQSVRLIDIFIYGPYLTYLAFQESYILTMFDKLFLLCLGMTTIAYNGRNYLTAQ
jgi:hypothetical protein